MQKKICLFLMSLSFLSGCSAYIDSRREAGVIGNIGQSAENRIALCYNPLFGSATEQQRLADESCAPKKAVQTQTKYFNCSLFYPNTAFYTCE